MKDKKYEVIAKNIIDIFMSQKSIEQQEKEFSELVNKEDKENLFKNISDNLLENLFNLEPLNLVNVLDKVIVNSLINDLIDNTEYPISLEKRKEFAQNYKDKVDDFGVDLSGSFSYYKYYKVEWDMQDGKFNKEEPKNYYEKNIEKIKAAFERIIQKERELLALHISDINIKAENKLKLSHK